MMEIFRPAAASARTAAWAERLALLCVALLFVLPFLVPIRRAPLPTLDGEMLAAGLLAAAALAVGVARRGDVQLQWPLPVFLVVVAVVGGVHWLTGRIAYTYSATMLFMALTALAMAYVLGRWLRQNTSAERSLDWIATALVAGAIASVLLQVLQFLDVRGLPAWMYFEMQRSFPLQPVANVGQPNQLAAYLALAIPAAVYLARGKASARSFLVLVGIMAAGIAFSLSRMGVLMLVLLSAWIVVCSPGARSRRMAFVAAIWTGFVLGSFLGPILLVEDDGASVVRRFLGAAYSDRTVMWFDALNIALRHPLLGTGVGEYASAQYWIAAPNAFTIGTPYAHNTVLQLAAEFGLAVAAAFVALTAWWLLSGLRTRWLDPVGSTVLAMGVLLLVHGMLEWSMWVLFVSAPAALLFALVEPETRVRFSADPRASVAPIGVAALVYLPLLVVDYNDVARLTGSIQHEQRIANRLTFNTMVGTMHLGMSTYFKPQADRLILIVAPVKPPVDDEDVARTRRVLSRLADAPTISLHISTLALAGRVDEASKHVERLRAFAVTGERYEAAEKEILAAIEGEGERVQPLRERLAAVR